MYADLMYYKEEYKGSVIPDKDIEKALKKASRHIDALTYNRIVGKGILNLTPLQQGIVKEACCEMADFEYENADALDCILQSYSINGVAMSFNTGWNMSVENGIPVKTEIYELLKQTGLCCRSLGVRM